MAEKPSVVYGQNFARLRKRAGLMQHHVADLLGYAKSSNANVSSIEVGRRALPRPSEIRRHAKLLNAEPWELLEGVETEYDRLRSGAPSDKSVRAAPGTSEPSRDETRAQVLLRRCENEQARVAATRNQLGQKIGAISKQLVAELGDLAAIVSRLPRGQAPVARRGGPGSPGSRQRGRRRNDRERPPESPPD